MSSIDLATRFNIEMSLLNREKYFFEINRYNTSFEMNCQPIKYILRYHKIDCYAIYTRQQQEKIFLSVLRPDLIGLPVTFTYLVISYIYYLIRTW